MTHVLDEAIERVMKIGAAMQEALACDGAEEHLVDQWSGAERDLDRILRAERDSPSARGREIESRARDAAAREVAGHRAAGREVHGVRAEREGRQSEAEGDWWCSECEEALPPSRVTYQERCDTCGSAVSWKEAHEPTAEEARAEGRREERERVVMAMRQGVLDTLEYDGGEGDMGCRVIALTFNSAANCIERGDHWRGGEG